MARREALDFFDVQVGNRAQVVGPLVKGPLFVDQTYGLVFINQTDGTYWQIIVSNVTQDDGSVKATLQLQQITLP